MQILYFMCLLFYYNKNEYFINVRGSNLGNTDLNGGRYDEIKMLEYFSINSNNIRYIYIYIYIYITEFNEKLDSVTTV